MFTYLKAANPTHFTVTVAYPIKGTSLYNEVEDNITVQPNWETSTDRDIDFKRTYDKKFYNYAVKHLVNEVNYNKELLKGRNKSLKKVLELKVKSIVALGLMKVSK